MSFRLKAFLVHIGSSATVLTLILGALYLGWYRWPGWYVTGVITVMAILVGVDLTLGPLITLLIADRKKPRREFVRDVGVVVAVQLIALIYGASALWIGRPLYYVFWVNGFKVVAASELPAKDRVLARKENPEFAPHWYSTPRWAWAPRPVAHDAISPKDASAAEKEIRVLASIIPMPQAFRPLSQAGDDLRSHLRKVDQISIFSLEERRVLKQRLVQRGLTSDTPDATFVIGYGRPLLAVFDPTTLTLKALIPAT
jgi:hypothetical protein